MVPSLQWETPGRSLDFPDHTRVTNSAQHLTPDPRALQAVASCSLSWWAGQPRCAPWTWPLSCVFLSLSAQAFCDDAVGLKFNPVLYPKVRTVPSPRLRPLPLVLDLHACGSVGSSLHLGDFCGVSMTNLYVFPSPCPPLHKLMCWKPVLSHAWVSGPHRLVPSFVETADGQQFLRLTLIEPPQGGCWAGG